MIQNDELKTVMVDQRHHHRDTNETIETIETAEIEIIPSVTIRKVHIEPASIVAAAAEATATQPNEVVSYQRFGRVDKKTITYPFKCHLCGFSCRFKESLLSHFKQVHPY